MKLTNWIPFVINSSNWEKAQPVAEKAISQILTGRESEFKVMKFQTVDLIIQPEMVLDIVGELWKTKAVEMMKGGMFSIRSLFNCLFLQRNMLLRKS